MSNYNFNDLTGKRFGRLTVLEPSGTYRKNGQYLWKCLCDCGKEVIVLSGNLSRKDNNTRSCGCLKKDYIKNIFIPSRIGNIPANRTHNHSKAIIKDGIRGPTPEYRTWQSMISRCKSVRDSEYRNYYAMGIKVCDRWLGKNGFVNFLKDMGNRPEGMSIDRKDPYKNYEPSNCRWANLKMQVRNKRKEINIKHLIYNKLDGFQVDMQLN